MATAPNLKENQIMNHNIDRVSPNEIPHADHNHHYKGGAALAFDASINVGVTADISSESVLKLRNR